jgi:hypothetical protein
MAATDLVPCFYTGQNYRVEEPADMRPRFEVRELKKQKLGRFIENGKFFLFFQAVVRRVENIWDTVSGKAILHFTKTRTTGDKLHYEMPMAGHKTPYQRSLRRLIHVSHRSLFSKQAIA